MKVSRADHRLDIRITSKQKERIEWMMEKHEQKRSAVVNDAIKEKFDRDFPKGLQVTKKNGS